MENTSAPTFIIRDIETMRVISDPLRAQIFEVLIRQPQTVRQVAERLGMTASKLYYHFNLLEKFGFIRVFETRQVANLIEKVYTVTSKTLDVDPNLFSFPAGEQNENLMSIVRGTIDTTREDLIRSLQARLYALDHGEKPHPRRVVINRQLAHLTQTQAEQFLRRIEELLKEFEDADQGESEDSQLYAMMIAFYPSFYFRGEAVHSTVEER